MEDGMSQKFKTYYLISLISLLLSYIAVHLFSHGNLGIWIRNIWLPVLWVILGFDFFWGIWRGWDEPFLTDERVSIFCGWLTSLLLVLAFKGIVMTINK
jgi:hypothetical protein